MHALCILERSWEVVQRETHSARQMIDLYRAQCYLYMHFCTAKPPMCVWMRVCMGYTAAYTMYIYVQALCVAFAVLLSSDHTVFLFWMKHVIISRRKMHLTAYTHLWIFHGKFRFSSLSVQFEFYPNNTVFDIKKSYHRLCHAMNTDSRMGCKYEKYHHHHHHHHKAAEAAETTTPTRT